MFLLKPPGVYRPQSDTAFLVESLHAVGLPEGAHVLDVGTGTGALAVEVVRAGATRVTAVDISRAAVLAARFNTGVRRMPVCVVHGDALDLVRGRRFDMILANPPYVPTHRRAAPRGRSRAWDAGSAGRDLIDPLCRSASQLLTPGGTLLLVHSAVCGVDRTLDELARNGMAGTVVARRQVPFGPVMRGRVGYLSRAGMIQPGQRDEELVVIRGERRR